MDQSLDAQLRATLNMIPAYTWYATPSGGLIFLNERSADYGGVPSDHPLRYGTDTSPAWDSHIPFLHPEDHEETRRGWSECLRNGRPGEVRFRARNAEGGYRWFLSRAEPLRANDGTILYWIGINFEIEERKQAEVELGHAVDTIPAFVWSALPDGSNVYVNGRFVEYSGIQPEDVAGTGWHAATHPDDLDRHNAKWLACGASGEPLEDEVRFRRSDGQYRWFLQRGVPLRDGAGRIVKWYGVLTDIEDRKQAEDRVREQETELRQMLDLAPQIIGVLGPRRERLYANRVALAYYGVTLEEWRQRSFGPEVHPEDFDRVKAAVDRSLANPAAYELEMRLRKGDGTYRWFLVRYNPLRDDQGQLIQWYLACTDIDDRRRTEERLHQENVALREEIDKTSMFEEIVGASPALTAVL